MKDVKTILLFGDMHVFTVTLWGGTIGVNLLFRPFPVHSTQHSFSSVQRNGEHLQFQTLRVQPFASLDYCNG